MNAKILILTCSSATFLMGMPGMIRAQEAVAKSTVAAADAADRQFLQSLEEADTHKSSATHEEHDAKKPSEAKETAKFDTYSVADSEKPSASTKERATLNSDSKAKETDKVVPTNETASAADEKSREKMRRTHREDPARPVEVTTETTTVIVNGTAELPEAASDGRVVEQENGRVEDHRFFHRLFGHLFHHDRDGQ